MNRKKILVLTSCLIFSLTTIFAQEKLQLSLADAKAYALAYNRTLQGSSIAVQKAEAAKWQAIASMLPHVDATLNYANFLGYEMKLNIMGQSFGSPVDPTGTLNATARIAFSGMQVVGVQLSNLAIDMSRLNKDISVLDVKANVSTAYFSILVAEESKKLLENSRENLMQLHATTEKMYEVGMAEQIAVDQLDVQVMLIENELQSLARNIELAYNALRLVLGSNDAELVLTETLDNFMANNNAYATVVSYFDINKDLNVQMLNQNIELNKKMLNLKRWEYAPTLAFFYQYSDIKYFGEEPMMKSTIPHTIGASLNIPIFSSGERLSKVRQAKFDLQTAKIQRADAIEGIQVQEKQLRFLLNSAIETYELQTKNLTVSERIFKNAVQKYELGVISSTDLTTINNGLISAQSSYISALMNLLTAQTNLQKLLNQL